MNLEFNSLKNIQDFLSNNRWSDVKRTYSPEDISKLRPPIQVSYTLSEFGSKNLWDLLNRDDQWVSSLGVATAQQAAQLYNLNYEMIYVSGWQVAAESNNGVNTYPDLSLYPSNSGPDFVQKINNTLLRIMTEKKVSYLPPVVADAESGFGGIYNVYNLTQQFIASGLAGIHFEDQLAAEKKCGHMGGKVVIPTGEYLKKLAAVRKSTAKLSLGAPNVEASVASLSTSTASSAGPQRNIPANAPVVDWTFGTPPVKSTSLTTIAGDSEGTPIAILLFLFQ